MFVVSYSLSLLGKQWHLLSHALRQNSEGRTQKEYLDESGRRWNSLSVPFTLKVTLAPVDFTNPVALHVPIDLAIKVIQVIEQALSIGRF